MYLCNFLEDYIDWEIRFDIGVFMMLKGMS